jgi:hypothetical protein
VITSRQSRGLSTQQLLRVRRSLPVPYVICNANLLQGRISKSEGSNGFIDGNTAWMTGPSAAEMTHKLQTQLLP